MPQELQKPGGETRKVLPAFSILVGFLEEFRCKNTQPGPGVDTHVALGGAHTCFSVSVYTETLFLFANTHKLI